MSGHHEILVYRLSQILIKLNQGEKLDPQDLADEFKVTLRTVQRDLNERFAYLPLVKKNGKYQLDHIYLGKLTTQDIKRFSSLAGVKGLFPSLSKSFLSDIFDTSIQSAILVKGHNYEDLTGKEKLFKSLEVAIIGNNQINLQYNKNNETKEYIDLKPYKLLNHKGIWYLVALDGDRLKTFSFKKVIQIESLDIQFKPDKDIILQIEQDDGIWIGNERIEIVLKISNEVASYFKRRKLIANQVIEKELEDGGLIISTKVGHENQVLPIVRYWIPHIKIISPEKLQQNMEEKLLEYINKVNI